MNNNDILRRLRYALDLSNKAALELFTMDPVSSMTLSSSELLARLVKQEETGYVTCTDAELTAFLDGLIVSKRGLREPVPAPRQLPADYHLTRNDILKKLRIAMNFKEEDMLGVLSDGGSELTKSELGAFFRKPGHKHYRACGNQVLRNFLTGLTQRLRT